MKAVGLYRYLPISDELSLQDVEVERPQINEFDLLVAVQAVAVNPVDTKVRMAKDKVELTPRILGWDAAGVVVAKGKKVTDFEVGDEVYYAGDITRQGCNAEFHAVDSRIVGHKAKALSFAQAAALPLTSITAWESLFERLQIKANQPGRLLILGGAGGVGSIAIQLAKQLTNLTVIATASRPQSVAWCLQLGADQVVDHSQALTEQLAENSVDFILCLNDTQGHWQEMAKLVAAQGRMCSIVETDRDLDMNLLKSKSVTFVWEFMFTRSMYQTDDMAKQGVLLNELSALLQQQKIKSTLSKCLSPINAENMRRAHQLIEKGSSIGKVVLAASGDKPNSEGGRVDE